MSAFWRGFLGVATKRIWVDLWLLATGFAIGVYEVRGQWWMVATYIALAFIWLRLSHMREAARA